MALLRTAWIEMCAQQLSMLRPGTPAAECKSLAERMWGSSGHFSPTMAAALLDRMLTSREGDPPARDPLDAQP
jgi:hypothetical protein